MATKKTAITVKGLTWYDFVEPTETDVESLRKKFRFHPLDCEDCLTENQRPKIDEYERYLFIVLHFPVWNTKTKRITTAELDIFIGSDFVITLHDGSLPLLEKIRAKCRRATGKRNFLERGAGYFLYELTSELFDACFPIVDGLWRTATQIERDVFDSDAPRDLLRSIMLLKKNTITFRRILAPERSVVSALEHKNKKFLPHDLEVYFDDVVDKVEKLWSSLDSLKEVGETLQDANESLISHTTSNTIRLLTVFSVILLPLTLISGLFGMNVPLPYASEPLSFAIIGGGMLTIVILMVLFFRWKKWL